MNVSLKNKIVSGLIWRGGGAIGIKILRFIISIILARLLLPKDFGLIAIATIFINLGEILIDGGFCDALIQRKKLTYEESNSVYWFNIFLAILLYIIIYFFAPIFSSFYNEPQLTNILRIIAISPFIGSLTLVPRALIFRYMEFKKLAIITWVSLFVGGFAAIILAYTGFGIWALVAEFIISNIIKGIMTVFVVHWKPIFIFKYNGVKELFNFGYKMLFRNILYILQTNLNTLFFGKISTMEQTAYYARGYSYPNLLSNTIDGTFDQVIFSAMSSVQDNPQKLALIREKGIQLSTFLSFPCFCLLAIISKELIPLMLTSKWEPCIPFLQLTCCDALLLNLLCIMRQCFNSIGRSDITLRLRLYLFSCNGLALICYTLYHYIFSSQYLSLYKIIIIIIVLNYSVIFLIFKYSRELLGYSFIMYYSDIKHNFWSACIAMIFCCFIIQKFSYQTQYMLIFKIFSFSICYIILSLSFHSPAIHILIDEYKHFLHKK